MRILQHHVEFIEFEPIKKEISGAEEAEKKRQRFEDILVLFVSVEEDDDSAIAKQAIGDAKEFLGKLKINRLLIYPYAHLSGDLADPSKALDILKEMEKDAKEEKIETYRAPFGWTKQYAIKTKAHPLAEQSRAYSKGKKKVIVSKEKKPMSDEALLARIRKSDFTGLPDTDHRIIGEKLDLFSFQEASPGMVYWHEKGLILFELLKNFIRSELAQRGYTEISTPALANTTLWQVSGHSEHYKDNMFLTKLGEEEFGMKPMNCPATFLIYKSRRWSYRELPVKYSIFDPLYRNELSGVASGLFRVKVLTQDDAHIITPKDKALDGVIEIIELMEKLYSTFGLSYKMKLSTMPDDHMGSDSEWEEAMGILENALQKKKLKYETKEKEGNFYSPKIDVDIKDSLGREWQCGTIQVDLQMPKRFRLSYIGEDGKEYTPAVIHRTVYGSLERFIGILIEHYQGKFPLWLSPVQVRVITLSEQMNEYAKNVLAELKKYNLRVELDTSDKTLEYKIRGAQLMKIPYMIVVGRKESENNTIAVRSRDGDQRMNVKLTEFVKAIKKKIDEKSEKTMF